MLTDYLTLGLTPGAADREIRSRYLKLIRRHTPEQAPERFQTIVTAYERIKDEPTRLVNALFGPMDITDTENALVDMVRSARPEKRRIGLATLLKGITDEGTTVS